VWVLLFAAFVVADIQVGSFSVRHHHRQICRTTNGAAATTAKITAMPAYNPASLGRFIIPMPQTITPYAPPQESQ
jgi:hypothetical protein